MTTTTRDRFNTLRNALQNALIERDAEIDALLLGLVAQEHVLFVGEPGTGKSLLCNSLTAAIDGAAAFTRLLTKFSTPEELFGPLSLSALRQDRHERQTTGYLPTAEIGYVDEVFKSSSAILNTLLTLMEERRFDNGTNRVNCPIRILIGSSNEYPGGEGQQELGAMFDRFLIRKNVRPVSKHNKSRLMFDALPAVPKCITLQDIDDAAKEASALPFSDAAKAALLQIVDELTAAGIRPGDRRTRKAIKVCRAAAWLDGEAEVEPRHLEALTDVLWSDPIEQPQKAAEIICRIANPIGARLQEILRDVDALLADIGDDQAKRMAALKKLEVSQKELKKLLKEGNGRAKKAYEYVKKERFMLGAVIQGIDKTTAEKNYAILCPAD
jgi:MoxR-like ATPase